MLLHLKLRALSELWAQGGLHPYNRDILFTAFHVLMVQDGLLQWVACGAALEDYLGKK